MIYFRPFKIQELLKLLLLLSEDTGMGYYELMHTRMEILLGLKKQKDLIIEERDKNQKTEGDNSDVSTSSLLSQAQRSVPSMSSIRSMAHM